MLFFSVVDVFLVVEVFFGELDGEEETSALARVELFFVVALVPDALPVVDFFIDVCVVELVVAVVSFLFAQAVKKAARATTVIKDRAVFFIRMLGLRGQECSAVADIASINSSAFSGGRST
ncbi:MAG: hypothetical protein ABJB69_04675 [Spartobacteria bacterium]